MGVDDSLLFKFVIPAIPPPIADQPIVGLALCFMNTGGGGEEESG
jgi:hypothetical protein